MPKAKSPQRALKQRKSAQVAPRQRVQSPMMTVKEHELRVDYAIDQAVRRCLPQPQPPDTPAPTPSGRHTPLDPGPSLANVIGQLEDLLTHASGLTHRLVNIRDRLSGGPSAASGQAAGSEISRPAGQVSQMLALLQSVRAALSDGHNVTTDLECYQG